MPGIAGMSTVGAEHRPAELRIRQLLAALPIASGEMRQRREIFQLTGGFVELAVTVLPGAGLFDDDFARLILFGLDKFRCKSGFLFSGLTSERDAIQLLDAPARIGLRA